MNTQLTSVLTKKLAAKKKVNGFTLVELMVFAGILGPLKGSSSIKVTRSLVTYFMSSYSPLPAWRKPINAPL